ncbi:MAG: MBL fold metallo-hydrolase [Clostridia bacterium]|nr:MBL fold metallo-hydrolase [Clostridia bacterium]
MKVYKISPVNYESNSYILTNDGKTAVIIDCARPELYDICLSKNLKPVAVLLTHGHFDHVGGCKKFADNGVPIACGEGEKDFIFSEANLSIFGGVDIPYFEISRTYSDGEEFETGGIKFKAISTPGHTEGGVCYIAEDCIFTGDTLFFETVGRTDFPTGNSVKLAESLKKLAALDGDYKIYCGHFVETTLNHERLNNPFIKC